MDASLDATHQDVEFADLEALVSDMSDTDQLHRPAVACEVAAV